MASLARDPNGRKRVQFVNGDGRRLTIRLGKMDVKQAESFRYRVESLIACRTANAAHDADLARWLASVPDDVHTKLERVGLVAMRESVATTLDELLDRFFETLDVKDSTRTRYLQTRRLLIEHFGKRRHIRDIRPVEGDRWRAWLVERGYAPAKIAREVGIARMIFRQGIRWELLATNPLEGVKAGSQHNRERLHYVTPEQTVQLLDAAASADWRCIIALARYGGLRCPSEVLRVRWEDVDWDRNRVRVRSPKTEGHAGKGDRLVPLFPEMRAVLLDAFESADEGSEYVVAGYRDATNANLRTQLLRIIRRTSLTPWPRLFNALRASRATELAAEYPAAVCPSWMGPTAAIAEAHFHMVRESDFEQAANTPVAKARNAAHMPARNAAQRGTATSRNESQDRTERPVEYGVTRLSAAGRDSSQESRMGDTGLEPVTSSLSWKRASQLRQSPVRLKAVRSPV